MARYSTELLAQAGMLAKREPRRPKQASLRRSISAADLQESRHDADYNLSRHFTRQDAATAADQAKEAIDAWYRLKAANEEAGLLFALSLMLWPGLGGKFFSVIHWRPEAAPYGLRP